MAGLATVVASACAGSESIDPGYDDLSGAGGTGTTGPGTTTTSTTSPTTGSSSPTTATGSGSSTSTTASSTATGMVMCNDTGQGEPANDAASGAVSLGTISDDDSEGQGTVAGVVAGSGDADWYRYDGSDDFLSVVDPGRVLTSSDTVRLCKFIDCDGGESEEFDCPSGTAAANSPEGHPGCCHSAGFTIDLTCGDSTTDDDNATVYIRVDAPNASADDCITYSVTYHY